MLIIPEMLKQHFSLQTELVHDWQESSCQEYYYEYINEKLAETLWLLNHKSTVGLAAALAEWILWRLDTANEHDFSLAISTIEPVWAGLIDKSYIAEWLYQGPYENSIVRGPLWVTMRCMNDVRYNYLEGKFFINAKVSTLAAIARLITPVPQFFDNWLAVCIKKLAILFPAEYDRNEYYDSQSDEMYDSSHELPIPREFYFDPDFDYKAADIDSLLATFINSLNYKTNEFLNPPEVMIEKGFSGIPYQYKGL